MQGHCWFALRVGNAVWHTVNSVARGTHLRSREGKRRRLSKLSNTDPRLLIYGIQSLLSPVYTVCFTNTLTKPPTSGYEVEVVKHTLAATLAKFMLQWERRDTFTSPCYLNSLKVWSAGEKKVDFAFSNMDLMKLAHSRLRERVQCELSVYASCGDEVKKCLRVKWTAHWTEIHVVFFICSTIFMLLEINATPKVFVHIRWSQMATWSYV